jgi:hypothetical protein
MDSFTKRLLRVCPEAAGFWRIEWQSRKSGRYEGKLFPHFHLLVWGLPERSLAGFIRAPLPSDCSSSASSLSQSFVNVRDTQMQWELVKTLGAAPREEDCQARFVTEHNGEVLEFRGKKRLVSRCHGLVMNLRLAESADKSVSEPHHGKMAFQDWASLAWYHVVASHNTDHLSAGLRVERVKTWGGVMSYCAKYMAKTDSGFLSDVQFGRSWGIFNRAKVPWARIVEVDLEPEVGNRLRRIARRYMEARRGVRVRSPYGLTLYCDTANWKRLWGSDHPPDPF